MLDFYGEDMLYDETETDAADADAEEEKEAEKSSGAGAGSNAALRKESAYEKRRQVFYLPYANFCNYFKL